MSSACLQLGITWGTRFIKNRFPDTDSDLRIVGVLKQMVKLPCSHHIWQLAVEKRLILDCLAQGREQKLGDHLFPHSSLHPHIHATHIPWDQCERDRTRCWKENGGQNRRHVPSWPHKLMSQFNFLQNC